MTQRTLARPDLEAQVRAALEREHLRLLFQPVVSLDTGEPCGVEALLRWSHPTGGLLEPDAFLPAIANTPTMTAVTHWVLQAACEIARRWPRWFVSVNVTALDLIGDDLIDAVKQALRTTEMRPRRLVLEMTETALGRDMQAAGATLGRLRDLGVHLALDDFGTGSSSMLYLRDLPVTQVKIDGTFVAGVHRNGDDHAIVASLITLAQKVGLTTTAEGVETVRQADVLQELQCAQAQGHLWSPAVPSNEADRIYREGLPQTPSGRPLRRSRRGPAADPRVVVRVRELLDRGASLHTIAAALNAEGHRTAQGARWHPKSVARLIRSSEAL